jgi:CHAT domain-containing protein/Tfp pilus assembly protein PilF
VSTRHLAILFASAAALCAQVQTPTIRPGTDFGADRSYRAAFDRLLTDGRYAEAEDNARALLARSEASNGPESIETALALDMLVELYYYGDRVRDPAAEQFAARAIAIKEKQFGPDDPRVAVSLRLIGNVMAARADYQRAHQFYERAVRIHRQTLGRDPRQEANALLAYSSVLAATGDLVQARSTIEEALSIRQRNFPPDTLNTAGALVDYATLLRDTGEYGPAEANYRRALAIYEGKLGRDHVINSPCLNEMGALLIRTGRTEEALPMLERALAIEEKAYGPDHVDLALVLNNLGAARFARGEWRTARGLYERALKIAEAVYGPDHPEVARILSGYAAALWRSGENAQAFDAALRTERIARAHLALTIRTLPEQQALLYASRRPSGIETMLTVALADPASRRNALDAVIRSRALVLDEMAARQRAVTASSDPEIARLSRELFAARERLSRLVLQHPATFKSKAYAEALASARLENDRAGRALAERSSEYRRESAYDASGFDEITAALRPGDSLVSFVRYGSDPVYAAFVLRPRSDPILVPLGPARRIDALVDAMRRQVQAEAEAPGVAPKQSEANYREAAAALRRQIWDPLEPALARASRVFITPDHALNLVDFGALPARGGGYLAERGPLLHYLSAERDLTSAPPAKSGRGLLAMGSPMFDRGLHAAGLVMRGARSTCMDLSAMQFDPLPAAVSEVHEVGALWRKAGNGEAIERIGEAASTISFKSDAPGRKALHVAAHAFYAGDGCRGANPLVLSGIAFTDGILTAEEITSLDLETIEWAVLSGCATGDGKLLPGEGVFGLRRAFRVAGAHTVIMSLWQVDDEATRTWMTSLYREHFAGAKSAAESVRAASLRTLALRRAKGLSTHPFYWAGFIAAQ